MKFLFTLVLILAALSLSYSQKILLSDSDIPTEEIWNYDTAYLTGHIMGYDSVNMPRSGVVQIMDILLHKPYTLLITISPNGDFYAEVPLLTDQEVVLSILDKFHLVSLSPGETSNYEFEVTENNLVTNKRFNGYNAQLNKELRQLDSISAFSPYAWKGILDLDYSQYRDYCLERMQEELDTLKLLRNRLSISKQAFDIKELKIKLKYYDEIFIYPSRKKSMFKREEIDSVLVQEELQEDFYDFLDKEVLTSAKPLFTGQSFNGFINTSRFSAPGLKDDFTLIYSAILDSVNNESLVVSDVEKSMIEELSVSKTAQEISQVKLKYAFTWDDFETQHSDLLTKLNTEVRWDIHDQKLKEYLGLEDGLLMEIINSRRLSEKFRHFGVPVTKEEIAEKISEPFIRSYVYEFAGSKNEALSLNNVEGQEITTASYNQSDAVYYFGDRMKQFEGKVLYVDFWATWCGPCYRGFEQVKPVKEELRNEPVEFVYFTNQTSKEERYQEVIQEVEGTHFKLDEDTWNALSATFSLAAIPHYIIIDKNGTIVDDFFFPKSTNHVLNTLQSLVAE